MNKTIATAAVLALSMFTAACGSDSSAGTDAEGNEKITVGIIPIADVAPLYLAQEKGIFADHGLTVEFEEAAGGAALIPAVVSGDYDYAFSNVVSLAVARSKGLPLEIIAPGASSTGVPGKDFGAVMTTANSGIKSPADLVGKRIAVNALSSINEMLIKDAVEKDGGNPDEVNFVELPHPDMPAALDRGDVDAIWEVEPFLTGVRNAGNSEVWSLYAEAFPDLTVATYFTTEQRIAQDSDQVERFEDALTDAYEYANEHQDEVRATLSDYTTIDQSTVDEMVLPAWPTEINRDSVQFQLDAASKWNLTTGDDVKIDDLIAEDSSK